MRQMNNKEHLVMIKYFGERIAVEAVNYSQDVHCVIKY